MIVLIDYRAGNLSSVERALVHVGAAVRRCRAHDDLGDATGIVLPGVGHFDATRMLDEGWRSTLLARIHAGTPLLGICLGLQWLFDGSDEAPDVPGLGVFAGRCQRLTSPPGDAAIKVPHVGWNTLVSTDRSSDILAGVPDPAFAYFTHSFAAPRVDDTSATTVHGSVFTSVVERGRVAGVQWHPEMSSTVGLQVLKNFLRWSQC